MKKSEKISITMSFIYVAVVIVAIAIAGSSPLTTVTLAGMPVMVYVMEILAVLAPVCAYKTVTVVEKLIEEGE